MLPDGTKNKRKNIHFQIFQLLFNEKDSRTRIHFGNNSIVFVLIFWLAIELIFGYACPVKVLNFERVPNYLQQPL